MPRKKIVFVIVEGPSDEEALGVLINRIYNSRAVYVHVMRCDITSRLDVNPENVVAKLAGIIRSYAGRTFKPGDFSRIIHITDTDGTYVPDAAVVEDATAKKTRYSPTEIRTRKKSGIEDRNRRKSENLDRLSDTNSVWNIPYRIYYMSCNLDHALYGKLNSTDDEKEQDSFAFAKKYRNDIPAFIQFLCESDFSVVDDYPQSWQYIREALHSLERHTNFGICIQHAIDAGEYEPPCSAETSRTS